MPPGACVYSSGVTACANCTIGAVSCLSLGLVSEFFFSLLGPWEHVVWMSVGAWLGYKYPYWEDLSLQNINRLRAERGMEPMEAHPWGYNFAKVMRGERQ